MNTHFSSLSIAIFLGIVAYLFIITISGLVKSLQKAHHPNYTSVLYQVVLGILAWLAALTILSMRGFFENLEAFPPRIMLALGGAVVVIVILAISKKFGKILREFPPAWLIWPQVFRVAVEIVLWMVYENGNGPKQMTFEGLNFDILAGITAPLAAWLAFGGGRKNYTLALVWNFAGLALLINILTVAVLSIPAIGVFESPNVFVAYFPFVLLPGFVAPYALMLHVISIRQLIMLRKKKK
jgi:hypothetical protein